MHTIREKKLKIEKKDIRDRIESDFGDNAISVFKLLEDAVSKVKYLNWDRIIRCIIFLAEKDIKKLKQNIKVATYDPRDVMLWAEYKNIEPGQEPKRIRDFNKTFDNANKNVKQ